MRLKVQILDARGRTYSEQELYVRGSAAAGEQAQAVGTIAMPLTAGSYVIEYTPVTVAGGPKRALPFRTRVVVT